MSFLLDTNVVSELRKSRTGRADIHVVAWAERTPTVSQFISVITVHELELGVRLIERRDPEQGQHLRRWLDDQVLPAFAGRIIPVSIEIARCAAALHVPDPRPERDAFIAATAKVGGLQVVTRNTGDFLPMGAKLFNPWLAPGVA